MMYFIVAELVGIITELGLGLVVRVS